MRQSILVHIQTKADFESLLAEGIDDKRICFIKETQEVYTHGKLYGTKLSVQEIEDIVTSSQSITEMVNAIASDNLYSVIKTDGAGGRMLYDDGEYKRLQANTSLQFYCIEPVTVTIGDEQLEYGANSHVSLFLGEGETFTVIPTSDHSIISLSAWPGALGTYYTWLEGVNSFSNILFDMNDEDMYTKWNQNNQGEYHVQKAQYINCIFWSDHPYINDLATRTNYTLYNSMQLPLCYSTIPANTYKPFYLAYGVVSDPNWSNRAYLDSYASMTYATQTFSYYGARNIGIFNMAIDPITLPKDCRGLMFYSPSIERAGVLDASATTTFGAKQGSWREAFGYCSSLRTLYIQNLKVSINVSWSPLENDSLSYIISNAANTSAITISLSPYTYYRLTDDIRSSAAAKNITLALIMTNYTDYSRIEVLRTDGDGTGYLNSKGEYSALHTLVNYPEDGTSVICTKSELEQTMGISLEDLSDAIKKGLTIKAYRSDGLSTSISVMTDANVTLADNGTVSLLGLGWMLSGLIYCLSAELNDEGNYTLSVTSYSPVNWTNIL